MCGRAGWRADNADVQKAANRDRYSRLIGSVFNDTYRLEEVVGRGGMGVVYAATHLRLSRRFAVKLLFLESAEDEDIAKRFRREAETTSTLEHPNIVDVVDFNQSEAGPYLVMELLSGQTFAERLSAQCPLPLAEIVNVVEQTAAGLDAAHRRGVVHRDLKPSNIFLCDTDAATQIKIVDFGISKVLHAVTQLTRGDRLIGTPSFMAPEQIDSAFGPAQPRTDIFALGAIIYYALSGKLPFFAEAAHAVIYKIVHDDPTPIETIVPSLTPAVAQVVNRALRKLPDERFPSAGALARALKAGFEGRPALVEQITARYGDERMLEIVAQKEDSQRPPTGPFAPTQRDQPKPAPKSERADPTGPTLPKQWAAAKTSRRARGPASWPVTLAILLSVAALGGLLSFFGSRSSPTSNSRGETFWLQTHNQLWSALSAEHHRNNCNAEATLQLAMLPEVLEADRRAALAALEGCVGLKAKYRHLARLARPNASVDPSLEIDADPDIQGFAAWAFARAGKRTQAQTALRRWHRERAHAVIASPELVISTLAALDGSLLPADLLRTESKTLAALAESARRALLAGELDKFNRLLGAIDDRAAEYEPALYLRTRLLLVRRRLSEAAAMATRLLAHRGRSGALGALLLADHGVSRGHISRAKQVLEEAIGQLSGRDLLLAARLAERLADICLVFRRQNCRSHALRQATALYDKAGDARQRLRAELLAQVASLSPEADSSALLKQIESSTQLGDQRHYIAAWLELRSGRRIAAAQRFVSSNKDTPAFQDFIVVAAETLLSLGRAEDAQDLIAEVIRTPAAGERLHQSIYGLYVASRAALMRGHWNEARDLARAFLVYWGRADADLLQSRVWRQRVGQTRSQLKQISAGTAVLYSSEATVGIIDSADPDAQRLITRLSTEIGRRYPVLRLEDGQTIEQSKRSWRLGQAPTVPRVTSYLRSRRLAKNKLRVIRLEHDSGDTTRSIDIELQAGDAAISKAALDLFPRPTTARYFGHFVAERFKTCNYCLRRALQQKDVSSAGANLVLSFAGSGRLLPSRVERVVPRTPSLMVCLRECINTLTIPPFGVNPRDRLTVRLNVALEPNWAALSTTPKLELAAEGSK
ncbi:MAG: serine/threonine protein kinase [Deltaproteobacteria bacterium]|nr:serine/threonine protein kinase [Deltaproteobacteria bacterium]